MARSLLITGLCALLLTACSTIATDHDFDEQADFSAYRSFQWIPASAETVADPLEISQLQDRRIRAAIERELAGKGITAVAGSPNLIVAYSTRTSQKTEVYDRGYGGYGYRGYHGSYMRPTSIDVYQYEEGTLIVDLIDAEKKQLVWRGKATGVVGNYENSEKQINEAVQKLFLNYPPKK
jgi:hypothetical protein